MAEFSGIVDRPYVLTKLFVKDFYRAIAGYQYPSVCVDSLVLRIMDLDFTLDLSKTNL